MIEWISFEDWKRKNKKWLEKFLKRINNPNA